jgi:hypothetical protein
MKLSHPYENLTGGIWLRGNLHTHTTQSDGTCDPQTVISHYASMGHDFLMLADHEVLTAAEQFKQWDAHGMIMIPGLEIAGGPHLLYVDADRAIAPRQPRQAILNRIAELARERGRGFAIMNHPNWESRFDHATLAQLQEWVGYAGIEIYNGVIGRLDGSPYALDKWDLLLSAGRRVWGYANDDSHRGAAEAGLGWNVAYVRERSVAGVAGALREGRFYASTGVVISQITVEGNRIRVETENADRIVAIRDIGRRIAVVDARSIEVEVPAGARYLRFACWGRGEAMAWTQPFFVDEADGAVRPTQHLRHWQASACIEHDSLDAASPAEAEALPFAPVPPSAAIPGFTDLRGSIQGGNGVVYARTAIPSARAGRGMLALGYDGPVRIWLNGREIFHGPGSNPAKADQLRLYVDLQNGANALLIALHSNRGKAWGFWCRAEQDGQPLQ